MYSSFVHIARRLNERFSVCPLLYGSLGLEKRLSMNLNADDIDVLIPERFLKAEWNALVNLMSADGYDLVDEHEHEFCNGKVTVAYAALEDMLLFAGIDGTNIPIIEDAGARFSCWSCRIT